MNPLHTVVSPWKTGVVALGGVAAAVLGATVVYGWHTHNITLLQIHPSFVPMQYNTALGFIGCAAVLLGLLFEWRPLVWAGGAGLLLIGPLTLAQYFFGVDLGIDQWFMRHYLTTLSSAPGRMAPNTALCFTLVGAFALIAMRPASPRRGFALTVLASFVIGLASVAAAGYAVSIETAYGWGNLTRMALHTSIGFLVVGVAAATWAVISGVSWLDRRLPLAIGIGMIFLTVILWQSVSAQQDAQIQQQLESDVTRVQTRILDANSSLVLALVRMAQRWSRGSYIDLAHWRQDAQAYAQDIAGLDGLLLVDARRKTLGSFGRDGVNFDVLVDAVRAAGSSGLSHVGAAVQVGGLNAQRRALVLVVPVDAGERDGWLIASIDIDQYFKRIINESQLPSLAVELSVAGHPVFSWGGAIDRGVATGRAFEFGGQEFRLHASHSAAASKAAHGILPGVVLLAGFAFAGVVSLLISVQQSLRGRNQLLAQALNDRDAAQRSAEANNRRLRSIFDVTPAGLLICDMEGHIVMANAQLEALFGYTQTELAGKPVEMLLPESLRAVHPSYRARFAADPKTRVMGAGREVVGRHRFGYPIPIEVGLNTFITHEGRYLLVTIVDITERKRAEVSLIRSEARFRSIVETSLDAVVSIDSQGIITQWNTQAEATFGWPSAEALGRNLADTIIPAQHRAAHQAGLARFLATGESAVINQRIEITALRRDGREFPVALAITEVGDGRDKRFTAFVHDISQRKEAENSLREAKERAESASRAKSDFVANMSHEIRTPLNAVIGLSHLLLNTTLDTKQLDYLNKIHGSSQALLSILNDILDHFNASGCSAHLPKPTPPRRVNTAAPAWD